LEHVNQARFPNRAIINIGGDWMFFELREYRTQAGQRENWVRFMEEEIIPFQVGKGMVIVGSYVGQEEDDLYIWIRRFESEEERERLYAAVYESDTWKNDIGPRIPEMMDRSKIVVRRIEATSRSVMQ
jgi:hypothetical protein